MVGRVRLESLTYVVRTRYGNSVRLESLTYVSSARTFVRLESVTYGERSVHLARQKTSSVIPSARRTPSVSRRNRAASTG